MDNSELERKRHEDTLAQRRPAGSYAPRPNRFGIQNWRMASTTVGMSRHASRPKDGVLRPRHCQVENGATGGVDAVEQDRQQQSVFDGVRVQQSGPREQPQFHDGVSPSGLRRNRGSRLSVFVESVLLIALCRMSVAAIAENSCVS